MVSTRSKSGAAPSAPAPPIAKKRAEKPAKASKSAAESKLKALPEVSLLSDKGNRVSTLTFITEDTPGLILFTYPRANTGGCTTQATGLSALKAEAHNAGFAIVGASYDSVKSQSGWKAKRDIKVDLLCDTLDVGLLKKLGAHKAPKGVKRSVFVFKKVEGGAIKAELVRYNISPKDCVKCIADYIKKNPAKGEPTNDDTKTE